VAELKDIIILGIETSCDETSAAVIKNGREVLSNIVSSQIEIHKRFGGVVPEIASRNHILAITNVVDEAVKLANIKLKDITAIAVTYGAGLIGALLVGVSYAKALLMY
jgi:N6-L-threonylcarbamoyladenine synthase